MTKINKLSRLDEFQRELAQVCIWDPNEEGLEPHVEINNTKINHIAKRKIIALGKEEEYIKASGESETLYNTLKPMPMGNLYFFIMDQISVDDLIKAMKEGKKSHGLYPYCFDAGPEFIEKIREVQLMINELKLVPDEINLGAVKFEYPDTATETALSALLTKSGLPEFRDLMDAMVSTGKEISDRDGEIKDLKSNIRTNEKTIERMRKEISSLSARAITQDVELEASHDGTIPSGTLKWAKASDIFGMKMKSDFDIPFWEWDGIHPDVPAKDEDYIFREELLTRVLYALLTNKRAYLQGHTGSGKTTLIEQVAAALNWPFIRINFDSEITRMDLIGRDTLSSDQDGKIISTFVDGILPTVMSGPYIACFDEIDFVRPDVAYVMQAALEGNGLRITEDGDRLVKPHEMFRMFATGNTVGQGDEHGMYQGARPQSLALLDRFTVWVKVDYLSPKERSDLLGRHFPALSEADHKAICQYTTEHLEAFTTGKCLQPISPRSMLAIAQATTILGDLKSALHMSVLDRASNTDHSTLAGLIDRVVK